MKNDTRNLILKNKASKQFSKLGKLYKKFRIEENFSIWQNYQESDVGENFLNPSNSIRNLVSENIFQVGKVANINKSSVKKFSKGER